MGATCSGQGSAFVSGSSAYPFKILLLGEPGVGKTFLLRCWQSGIHNVTEPLTSTTHFNVGMIKTANGLVFMVYDLAGDIGLRLRPFLDGTEGVIYMFKAAGVIRDDDERTLEQLLRERDLENAPILFVSRTTENVPSESVLSEKLLSKLDGRRWDMTVLEDSSQESANLVLSMLEKLLRHNNQNQTEDR
ncbi:uncharacterized protein LOC101858960 [Aplysia californica]|uniref:Uncharacterized protein LOC101858960 n=1 Tax=Aplysia californica TaxID=6500 RepID=A0ABM0K0U7_APLCA|nr:uncharacterized protein LOC101858960 [Aplysia californica]XP_035827694.1 uncharacterized protein LOC101858960 [Aplysia californica]